MLIEECLQIDKLVNAITSREILDMKKLLLRCYNKENLKRTKTRAMYQKCKIVEELGELGQALMTNKRKPEKYSDYEDVRGTIESELADVFIAVFGYTLIKEIELLKVKNLPYLIYDAHDIIHRMLILLADQEYSKIISLLYTYAVDNEIDLLYNVRERIAFNNLRMYR